MSTELRQQTSFDAAMASAPVIAIVRLPEASSAAPVVLAVHRGGIRLIEVTLTTAGALDAVATMRDAGLDGLSVGMGSVRTADEACDSIAAGAEYLVTPTTNLEVLRAAQEAGVPVVCGAFTPTELDTAHRAGADYVKLFPASVVGPRYLREVLAPMPDLRIVRRVGSTSRPSRSSGPRVRSGSALAVRWVDKHTVAAADWAELERRATALVTAWRT